MTKNPRVKPKYVIRNRKNCRKKDIEIRDMNGKETIFDTYQEADRFRMSMSFKYFKRSEIFVFTDLITIKEKQNDNNNKN